MKKIKVRKDKNTGTHYLKLEDFSDFIDTQAVKQYTLEVIYDFDRKADKEHISLLLIFYDADGNRIDAKEIAK